MFIEMDGKSLKLGISQCCKYFKVRGECKKKITKKILVLLNDILSNMFSVRSAGHCLHSLLCVLWQCLGNTEITNVNLRNEF